MKPARLHRRNDALTNRLANPLGVLLALAFIAPLQPAQAVHAAAPRTVALTGQPAPGTQSGVIYDSFGSFFKDFVFHGVVLNDLGQTAFRANVAGVGVDFSNDQGVWSEGSGSMSLVARTGNQAPGAPSGVTFRTDPALELFMPVLNDAGQTAFYGATSNSGFGFAIGLGLWAERSGNVSLVARSGQQAPGALNGVTFTFANLYEYLEAPVMNDAGKTTFRSYLHGPGVGSGNKFGLWSEGSGSLQLVARLGGRAQGQPAGVNHGYMYSAGLNDVGQSVFFSYLSGSGVNGGNDHSLWSEGTGNLTMIARTGSQAPGMPSGVNFTNFHVTGGINNAGQTPFVAGLSSVNSTYGQEGLWLSDAEGVRLLAMHGMQATGLPTGVVFEDIGYWPGINEAGQTLFFALLSGEGVDANNETAVFLSDSDGNLKFVSRKGDQAPGTPDGTYFFSERDDNEGAYVLNDAGQVAATGRLRGVGVNLTNDFGVWATDRTGALQLIAREGDAMEVAPGDSRTISELVFVGSGSNGNGWASAFNNLGQLAYWAKFTDGTQGVFLSNAVANFTWKNLTKVHFFGADMTGMDLTGADARGAPGLNLSGATTTNLIRPDGHIAGLNLAAGERLMAYPGVSIPVQVSGGFSIASDATFDLTDNDLIVRATAATKDAMHADVQAKIATAQNGVDSNFVTKWDGPGVTSSSARAANVATGFDLVGLGVIRNSDLDITTGLPGSSYTSFSDQPVTPDDVLVKYTYIGDANLNGVVSFDDYAGMDNAFFGLIPNLGWATGDINFDGAINFDDYSVVDQAFFFQGASLSKRGAMSVPEPGTFALVLIGSMAAMVCVFIQGRRARNAGLGLDNAAGFRSLRVRHSDEIR